MDIQQTLDNSWRFQASIEQIVARAYRDAAEVLTADEIEECRREAAVMTSAELEDLLVELRR